jgi:hypothetical protein
MGSFIIALAASVIFPALAAAQDSPHIFKLLLEAKHQAFQLNRDASEMETFNWTAVPMSFQSHTEQLIKMKDDVNTLVRQVMKLDEARGSAAPWQQAAIDRITPVLNELASNTTGAIELFNDNPKNRSNGEYEDYIEANAAASARLASMVSDYVHYGREQRRLARLSE